MSSWIPILWRNPNPDEGTGSSDPGMAASAESLIFEIIENTDETLHDVARDLGLESERVVQIGTTPYLPPSEDAILDQYRMLEKLPDEARPAMWQRVLGRLRSEGIPCSDARCETYEGFREALAEVGESFPYRVRSLRSAMTLIQNHASLGYEAVDRPIALAVVASSDHNGAMSVSGGFPLLDTLEENGYFHVLYVEADEEDEILQAMEEVYALTGRRVHTLILGGHGTCNHLALSGDDLAIASGDAVYEEADYLDTADFFRGDFSNLDEYLEADGQILLWSCSTGSGGEEDPFNLANSVSRAAPGRRVYSMMEPGNLRSLEVLEDGSLAVEWSNDAPYIALSADGTAPEMPAHSGGQNGVAG